MTHGSPAIRYRLATEVFPGLLEPEALLALRLEVDEQSQVKQIARKQKETGVWGGNLLGVTPNKATGVKDVGTIPQYRRLVELGLGKDARPTKMAARVLFRLVSRDEDPKLLFEYAKLGAAELDAEPWIREILREAATAALAHAGHGDDPRVRGAAHKILNQVSAFVRSELAENPFAKSGRAWVLHPQAHPPTIFSISLLASLPAVQRERAGLVERLGQYLALPAPKKAYTVPIGKKSIKPNFLLLGDPLHLSASGQPDDLPFALYWLELLARLGVLSSSPSAAKVWSRLLKDTGKDGVWHPKGLRALPKAASPWAYHMFPLHGDSKSVESKQTDVTFRMALIARIAGMELTAT
jgi:hypothetical protein